MTSAVGSGDNMGNAKEIHDFIIWIYTHCGHFDTIIFSLPIILITTMIYWAVRRILHKRKFGSEFKKVRRAVCFNEMIRLLTVCWLTALLCLTLTPTEFWKDFWLYIIAGENPIGVLFPQLIGLPPRGFGDIVLTPTILRYALKGHLDWFLLSGWLTIPQMLLNIVLFVPLGLAAPFISKKSSFLQVAVTGLSLSFLIEFIQIFIGRECSMDDLICNTLGAIIGYLMYLLLRKLFPKFVEKCKKTARGIWVEAIEAEHQTEENAD